MIGKKKKRKKKKYVNIDDYMYRLVLFYCSAFNYDIVYDAI